MDNPTSRKRRTGKLANQQLPPTDSPSVDTKRGDLSSPTEDELNLSKMDSSLADLDGSAVSVSPSPNSPIDPQMVNAGGSECRRSSRKKIIKFDVRDLLNKNRKPHKIQIEARIDSNAPVTETQSTSAQIAGTSVAGTAVVPPSSTTTTPDLTTKQKTFIEKSAIFRRYSISEQQNKITPPRPPIIPVATLAQSKISLLSKPGEAGDLGDVSPPGQSDPAKIAQARRLSRTQEIFNASMIKSKQNSSLIVAQMESPTVQSLNVSPPTQRRTTAVAGGKRRGAPKMVAANVTKVVQKPIAVEPKAQPKRRGRPPKNKPKEAIITPIEPSQVVEELPEEPQCSTSIINESVDESLDQNISTNQSSENKPNTPEKDKSSPEKAKSWKEYKDCFKDSVDSPCEDSDKNAENLTIPQSDIILEISSSSSILESEEQSPTSLKVKRRAVKQRNFAAVSFLHEISNVNDDNLTAPEFIVAAVEEIITEPNPLDSCESSILPESKTDELEGNSQESSTKSRSIEMTEELEGISQESSTKSRSIESSKESVSKPPSLSRSSSSSESETNSDRSSKTYKHGDRLRVSLKRLSAQELSPSKGVTKLMSSSPTISVCSISSRNSSNDNSTTTSNQSKDKKYIRKRFRGLHNEDLQQEQVNEESLIKNSDEDNSQSVDKEASEVIFDIETVAEVEVSLGEEQGIENEETIVLDNTNMESPKVFDQQVMEQIEFVETDEKPKDDPAIEQAVNTEAIIEEACIKFDVAEPNVVETAETHPISTQPSEEVDNNDDKCVGTSEITHVLEQEQPGPSVTTVVENLEIVKEEVVSSSKLPEESKPKPEEQLKPYLSVDNPKLSPQSKDQIMLPLKKQIQKIKIFESMQEDANKFSQPEPAQCAPKLENISQITEQVDVETKTLLDILKTVQSNETAAAAAAAITECPEQLAVEESTVEAPPKKKSVSPCRSDSSSPYTVKKSARRYDRRSRRGEEKSSKTLEETFAEIAATSSKVILEEAALQTTPMEGEQTLQEECQNLVADVVSEEVEIQTEKEESIVRELAVKSPPECENINQTMNPSTSEIVNEVVIETETIYSDSNLLSTEQAVFDKVTEEVEIKSETSIDMKDSSYTTNTAADSTNIELPTCSKEASITELKTDILCKIDSNPMTEVDETIVQEQIKTEEFPKPDPVVHIPAKRGRKPKAKQKASRPSAPDNLDSKKDDRGDDVLKIEKEPPKEETLIEEQSKEEPLKEQTPTEEPLKAELLKEETPKGEESTPNMGTFTEISSLTDVQKVDITENIVIQEQISTLDMVKSDEIILENVKTDDINVNVEQQKIPSVEVDNNKTAETLEVAQSPIVAQSNPQEVVKEIVQDSVKTEEPITKPPNETNKPSGKVGDTPKQPPKKRIFKPLPESDEVDSENPTLECSNVEPIKETSSSKKLKKLPKSREIIKSSVDSSTEDGSNSGTNTPTPKRSKSRQKKADVPTESIAAAGSKKKTKKMIEEVFKLEKVTTKSSEKKQDKSVESKSEKKKFLETEDNADGLCKLPDEPSTKKKRQKKLKEAFEAALKEPPPPVNPSTTEKQFESKSKIESESSTGVIETKEATTPERESPPLFNLPLTPTNIPSESSKEAQEPKNQSKEERPEKSSAQQDEDPDPLKDIEKFIEDGVNLLKRGYKIDDDDDVEGVIPNTNPVKPTVEPSVEPTTEPTIESQPNEKEEPASKTEIVKQAESRTTISTLTSFADTPADTPLATPTVTPPPKSPLLEIPPDDPFASGVRRSHRIKQNSKTPKALVGRGLVRDKERFSLKDDVETKSHYTIDDHRMDLAEVEAKNAKFLKEMEERLSNFRVIKENEYKCERIVSKEAKKMICDCFLTAEEEGRGELGCGEDCLNRLLMIECGPDCNVKDRCTNRRFQKYLCSPCRVFRTEKKGFGIMADIEILPGEFIMEYVGEVINGDEFERRRTMYSLDKNRHYYFMALRSDAIIDATNKGNISRFINHSCDPNAETQKWTVNGELRIGFFSRKSIMPGEEITFDYQYQRYGREAQRCYCESSNCRGWIGEEPNSDEGEQVDDDSDEENLAESLLDDDDEDDSDETDADAEEAQKKLEIAAAEAKLMPITEEDKKKIEEKSNEKKKKLGAEFDSKKDEEDSKSKFKKLLSKMAEKVAKKKKQKERKQRKRREDSNASNSKSAKPRFLEDPDIEDEVHFLSRCGLKNQSDTLRLSRLMVRAKLPQTRLNLLKVLRSGDLPCRRLFLDYHGLRLLHGWMSEDGGDLEIRMALLETLETLPIANKTMLTDSKVYQSVRNWCGSVEAGGNSLSPSDESSKESSSSNTPQTIAQPEVPNDLQKLASKLTTTWDSLPEIFRIPKRERIEQMKEHEREADRQYAAVAAHDEEESKRSTVISDRYQRDRFGRGPPGTTTTNRFTWSRTGVKEPRNITTLGSSTSSDPRRRIGIEAASLAATDATKHLSKEQRREMFAAKVARDEAEKRMAEERREFETKCRFFGLDPKKTRPQNLPLCVNPATGQWYSIERQPIPTPPTYAYVQVPVKAKSTNPEDYQLPVAAKNLPPKWKFSITPKGRIYYYHIQFRIPQWEPPTNAQTSGKTGPDGTGATTSDSETETDINESTDDDDEIIKGMDAAKLQAYREKKIEIRRQQRYTRLVGERSISPRREEDRIYNQIEVRKYKENKEKIRKRKEEIRRRRIEAAKNATLNMCTLGNVEESAPSEATQTAKTNDSDDEQENSTVLPIQDYLLSSDEEDTLKAECNNSPLIDKIVQGDKIVDELDALTTNRTLKRQLPSHRDLSGNGASSSDKHDHKKRKLEKRESSKSGKKSKDQDSKYRKLKEKFRCEIAGIIVHHLKPYRKASCIIGRIQNDEDFNHLARKLTHFVMIKELKYCESVGQTLVVTESVKNKSREFIKKYMAKYGDVYVKPENDPEFKDIPFTL